MQNTAGKKQAGQEGVDSDYRFDPDRIIGLQVRALLDAGSTLRIVAYAML